MAKYRKRSVIIEAVQWFPADWKGHEPRKYPCGVYPDRGGTGYWIDTLEGRHEVTPGDWIIRGIKGETYPCKDEIFKMTYDEVEDNGRLATVERAQDTEVELEEAIKRVRKAGMWVEG